MSEPGRAAAAHAAAAQPRRPLLFPDNSAALYTVGQVADMLGVQPAFLRRLDAQHAVSPQRSPGGQRRYSRHEIDRIDALTGLLDQGMTLAGAQRIIELQYEVAGLRRQLAAAEGSIHPSHRPTDDGG